MKRKFALTMEFVEEYLKEVVNQPFPFGDKEKNKLTFEVFFKKEYIHEVIQFSLSKIRYIGEGVAGWLAQLMRAQCS